MKTIVPNIMLFFGAMLTCACGCAQQNLSLRPSNLTKLDSTITLDRGNLRVTFANNRGYGTYHQAGYSGISELSHLEQDSLIFVPSYSGFNLEFIISGDSLPEIFEPRRHPVELYYDGANKVMLYQTPTPDSRIESLTTFELNAPHFIDVTFKCIVHIGDFFQHGYAALVWASYINVPENKRIYFKGLPEQDTTTQWISAFSEKHAIKSTHRGVIDQEDLYFSPNFNICLINGFSDYRYKLPFYFGRFHNMVFAYLFDSSEIIRFTQSPTGGGKEQPAWDFQYVIPKLKFENEYSFSVRLIYKPFVDGEDIEEEYRIWKR